VAPVGRPRLAILHPRSGVTCALGLNPNRAGDWAPVSIFQDSNGLQHQMGLLRDAVPSLGAPALIMGGRTLVAATKPASFIPRTTVPLPRA
jgi:hypothetical protein